MELREDQVVMCTVKSIEGTTVFLEIEGNGTGSMAMSEVAAGRIRNLRELLAKKEKKRKNNIKKKKHLLAS